MSIVYSGYVDIDGNAVERTPRTHPYTYDSHVIFRKGENSQIDNTAYTDRMRDWNYEKLKALRAKYFPKAGDYYPREDAKKIEQLLREYFDAPKLKLIVVTECCNVSSGYPVWCFHMKMNKE